MANNNSPKRTLVTTPTTPTTPAAAPTTATTATMLPATSGASPAMATAPGNVLFTTVPTASGTATAPQVGSVWAACLAYMAANGGHGTPVALQAAIAGCNRKGAHGLLQLARWQARNRGWYVVATNSQVVNGVLVGGQVYAYPTLAAYQAAHPNL